MESIIYWVLIIIVFKNITVGCEFNLYYWSKYKKKYTWWYFGQETFKQFLKNGELKK